MKIIKPFKSLKSLYDLRLFVFYLIFYAGERIYRLATVYSENLIYHSIGLQIGLVSPLFYLIFCLKDYEKPAKTMIVCYPMLLITGLGIYATNGLGLREATQIPNLITHVLILMTISRIIDVVTFSDVRSYIIWTIFWGYRMAALACYFFVQKASYLKYDYDYLLANWGSISVPISAAGRYSNTASTLESICVPSLIFITILFLVTFVDKIIPKVTPIPRTNTVLILIKRPSGWVELIKLIFWHGEISVVSNGMVYDHSGRIAIEEKNLSMENYFIIDTLIYSSNDIDKRISHSSVDKSRIAVVTSIPGYERLFLTSGFKRTLLLILIRWLSFSVSELNHHPEGMPLREILVTIFKYPIESLKKMVKEFCKK